MMDFEGILSYLYKATLKETMGDTVYDLVILSSLIEHMGGLIHLSDYSDVQIACMSGGGLLQSLTNTRSISNRNSSNSRVSNMGKGDTIHGRPSSSKTLFSWLSKGSLGVCLWISLGTLSDRLLYEESSSSSPSIITLHIKSMTSAIDFVRAPAFIYMTHNTDV